MQKKIALSPCIPDVFDVSVTWRGSAKKSLIRGDDKDQTQLTLSDDPNYRHPLPQTAR